MSGLPPLASLRAFEAAARHLSFKRAASELGVTPTAISHQVRLLEDILGKRLFERRARQVVLTSAGHELQAPLTAAFATLTQAVERVRERRVRRSLTLSATTAFSAKWLVPRVARFARTNPGLSLRLHASDEPVDLQHGEADAAVRYGRAPFPGLLHEPLFDECFAPVCSPRLGVSSYEDLEPGILLQAEWRRPSDTAPTWQRWCRAAGLVGLDTAAGAIFLDDGHLIQATVAGQGVALLSLVLVAEELASGLLVQPFGPTLPGDGYHLVWPAGRTSPEVEALRSWFAAELPTT